jgi:cytosolic carboxypeptidase protein 2/3
VIHETTTSETSLRHLFYLEYKKNFPEGQRNPIVYSRFGKEHYRSDDKFDVNNFN